MPASPDEARASCAPRPRGRMPKARPRFFLAERAFCAGACRRWLEPSRSKRHRSSSTSLAAASGSAGAGVRQIGSPGPGHRRSRAGRAAGPASRPCRAVGARGRWHRSHAGDLRFGATRVSAGAGGSEGRTLGDPQQQPVARNTASERSESAGRSRPAGARPQETAPASPTHGRRARGSPPGSASFNSIETMAPMAASARPVSAKRRADQIGAFPQARSRASAADAEGQHRRGGRRARRFPRRAYGRSSAATLVAASSAQSMAPARRPFAVAGLLDQGERARRRAMRRRPKLDPLRIG